MRRISDRSKQNLFNRIDLCFAIRIYFCCPFKCAKDALIFEFVTIKNYYWIRNLQSINNISCKHYNPATRDIEWSLFNHSMQLRIRALYKETIISDRITDNIDKLSIQFYSLRILFLLVERPAQQFFYDSVQIYSVFLRTTYI